ncbi:MAG: hypothetical protein C4308_04475 [Chitinophagaceae bacterium]
MKTVYIITIIGTVLGAIAGWLYWRQIGCSSGTCMITSKPLNSTLYGALLGFLLGNLVASTVVKPSKKSSTSNKEKHDKND